MTGTGPAGVDGMGAGGHCTGCGQPVDRCAGCGRPLDPPRHCPSCGGRLRVVVTPTGWSARCRHHGDVA